MLNNVYVLFNDMFCDAGYLVDESNVLIVFMESLDSVVVF
jgi:hypothetical protein